MALTPCHVLLGLSVAIVALGFTQATPEVSPFQNEIRKRIFCNFYGCGSKRSGGTAGLDLEKFPGNEALDGGDPGNEEFALMDSNYPGNVDLGMEDSKDELSYLERAKLRHALKMLSAMEGRIRHRRALTLPLS